MSTLRTWAWDRMLHDSVVNTLAAIAAGRVVTSGALVRQRCEADLVVIGHLLQEHRPPAVGSLVELLTFSAQLGLSVERRDASTLDALLAASSDEQRLSALAVISEALLNVAKHAQTDRAEITCRTSTREFQVIDRGVGLSPTSRRLLQISLDRRVLDGDLVVALGSPGEGTIVSGHIPDRSMLAAAGGRGARATLRIPTLAVVPLALLGASLLVASDQPPGVGRTLWVGIVVIAFLLLRTWVADLAERARRTGLAEALRESETILKAVAADPDLVRDRLTQARAALEESYLRALIAFSSVPTRQLAAVVNHARALQVRLELGREASSFDGEDAAVVLRLVDGVVGRCPQGSCVSVSRYRQGPGRLVIVVAPADALDGLADLPAAATVLTFVGADDSWVEIRWTPRGQRRHVASANEERGTP